VYRCKDEVRENLFDIKWAPISGKCTFKVHNLRSYLKDGAFILLFCNLSDADLRKPLDYDFDAYIQKIQAYLHEIKYAVLTSSKINKVLTLPQKRVHYMGNKLSVIIPENRYDEFFTLRDIHV
jgi:hypothetical protein